MAGEAVPGIYAKAWTDIVLKTKGDFIRNTLIGLRNDLNNQETGFLFITVIILYALALICREWPLGIGESTFFYLHCLPTMNLANAQWVCYHSS